MSGRTHKVDVVIFGGGIAGLWLLDDLVRDGYAVLLLEANALGSGQTVSSQGIIHGGLKYALRGLVSPSARAVREMPHLWRRSLAGEGNPDLAGTRLRAEFCHLWHDRSLRSRLSMLGARAGLRTVPQSLRPHERPAILRDLAGTVARLDEQVIEPESALQVLASRHDDRILRIDARSGLEFERHGDGTTLVRLLDPERGVPLDLEPRTLILTAGAGNARLREQLGLRVGEAQLRPLHMVAARGRGLPDLNGHCVDGLRTRATITTSRDHTECPVWQIGGQIAEDGVDLDSAALIAHTRREVMAILPQVDFSDVEWMSYRVDRAEMAVAGGRRPHGTSVIREGIVISAWPTKLVLAPRLSARIREQIAAPHESTNAPCSIDLLNRWPRPIVAVPPWEEAHKWIIVP